MSASETAKVLVGIVKFFDMELGYGFVTVTTPEVPDGVDVLVHHSVIETDNSGFKYLEKGWKVTVTAVMNENGKGISAISAVPPKKVELSTDDALAFLCGNLAA